MKIPDYIPIPYREFETHSRLSVSEIREKIQARSISQYPWFRSPPDDIDFIGDVEGENLSLIPVTKGMNTYQPLVKLKLKTVEDRTKLSMVQTLNPKALLILILFFGSMLYYGLSALTVISIFLTFHIGMHFIGFVPEAMRVEKLFKEMFR
jgi:hypothetical protein